MKYNLQKLFNTVLVATVYLLGTTRKSIGGVTRLSGGTATVWAGLSMVYGADASPTTVNLEAGVPVNVLLDLTQLTGTIDIASVVIKYPQNFTQNGLKLVPQFVRNYTQGEIREAHQILTDDVNRVTEKFSEGVQLGNEESLTSFLYSEGQLKWRYKTGRGIETYPAMQSDGTIYTGSTDACVYAIYPNGNLTWKYCTDNSIGIYNSLTVTNEGLVYVGSANYYLYAIDPNGKSKWKYPTNAYIDSAPAIGVNGTIYFGSFDSGFYAIYPDGSLQWRYQTGGAIVSSPVIASDGTIYFGSCDHYLYAVYSNGTLRWRYQTYNEVQSSPVIANDNTILVGSWDNYIYAIYPSGALRWRYQTGRGIYSSPAISNDGTIYIGSRDHYLHAIYINGTLKCRYQTEGNVDSSPVIATDGMIYVGSYDRYIYAISPDCKLKWRYQTENMITRSAPIIANDGTIYVGSYDSYLYAISGKTVLNASPWPQFHQNTLHTGVQAAQQGLQLFDIRYLRLEGTPTIISGLLQLDLAMSAAQVPSFNMNINFITSPSITNNNLSSCTVTAPVPDQTIDVDSQYSYQINGKQIFSDNIQYVSVTETGKSRLPKGMILERTHETLAITNSPTLSGSVLRIVGDILYMTASQGLSIIDIKNPFNPSILGNIDLIGAAHWGLEVKGNIAYVNAWRDGMYILDVSNNYIPKVLSRIGIETDSIRLKVVKDVAYVTTEFGLQLINVKDPNKPILMGRINSGRANHVDVVGDLAYLAAMSPSPNNIQQLQIVNVSNNYNPILLGSLATGGAVNGGWSNYVVVKENVAYVATASTGLKLIDVSDPLHPKLLSTISASDHGDLGPGVIDLVGQLAYVGFGNEKLQIIDVSNPVNPVVLENYTLSAAAVASIVVNNCISFASTMNFPHLHVVNFCDGKLRITNDFLYQSTYYLTTIGYGNDFQACGNVNWQLKIMNNVLAQTINLNNGLVAYYPFNGNANDESGHGHHGIVMGATLTSDKFGNTNKAYRFDGINSYIMITATTDLKPAYLSISLWAKRLCKHDTDWQQIVSATERDNKYLIGWYYDSIRACTPYPTYCLSSDAIVDHNWHHMAITYEEGSQELYVDGILSAKQTVSGPITGYNSRWVGIGAEDEWQQGRANYAYFCGDVTEVRIYNRALTQAEVTVLYRNNSTVITPTPTPSYSASITATLTETATPSLTPLQPMGMPILINNKLTIKNGKVLTLTTKNFNASNSDGDYYNLLYRIIALRHGWFTYINTSNTEILSFSQKNITDGLVQFNHDGSKFAPHYNVTVSNGALTTTSTAAQILFDPVPIFYNNFLTVSEGQSIILSTDMLKAVYPDDYISDLSFNFIISDLQHGHFESVNNSGVYITSFTQQSLSDSNIKFIHDNSDLPPSYKVAIDDGTLTTDPVAVNVTFIRTPFFTHNFLIINQGETLIVNNSMLSGSSDQTNNDYDLIFTVSEVKHGHFESINDPEIAITKFNQQQINNGQILFVHDGTDKVPSYKITISNGILTSKAQEARIRFNAHSNDTSNIAAIVGGTLGGCLSSLAVAGVGLFFYKKRYSTSKLNQLERTLVPLVNAEKEEPIANEQISILVNQSEVNPNVLCNSGLNEARSSLQIEESRDSKHKFHYNQNPTKHRKTLSL